MSDMTRDEVYEWLRAGAGWVHLGTVGRDGAPHVVPLGYFVLEGTEEIILNMRGQREANVRRDPRVSLCWDAGSEWTELKGVVMRGTAEIIDDPEGCLEMTRAGARARGVPEEELPTEARRNRHFARVTPVSITSWDNRKLPPRPQR